MIEIGFRVKRRIEPVAESLKYFCHFVLPRFVLLSFDIVIVSHFTLAVKECVKIISLACVYLLAQIFIDKLIMITGRQLAESLRDPVPKFVSNEYPQHTNHLTFPVHTYLMYPKSMLARSPGTLM